MIPTLFLVAAIIVFAVAAAGGTIGGVVLVPLGLALLAASFLPWGEVTRRAS